MQSLICVPCKRNDAIDGPLLYVEIASASMSLESLLSLHMKRLHVVSCVVSCLRLQHLPVRETIGLTTSPDEESWVFDQKLASCHKLSNETSVYDKAVE